ncbi:MAG: methyltransferase domain-containing protein [Thermoplasmata archaeon]|nr:methyltransferase domain-containing protein [Thermoplasmata archaeon]
MAARPPDGESLLVATPRGAVPLGYVQDGPTVYLVARERSAQWPIELLRTGVAELRLADGAHRGEAALVRDAGESVQILERFRRKYGDERFARWYDRPARVLRVDLVDQASVAPGHEAQTYYRWLESEFDVVAADYDHHITGNRMNRLLRDRSLARLRPLFRDAPRLLEVGCGSGMETLPLLREGHSVTAVDISERMLDVVRTKTVAEKIESRLTTRQLRASELSRLVDEVGPEAFDGAYSTYGAINCEPDLRPVSAAFHDLLKPNASLVLGIYNRWCLFELLGYTMSLQGARAFGRRSNPVRVGASRFCVDVYAYSVSDVVRAFHDGFRVASVEGVPVALPPSDLTGYAEKFARHFDQLASFDAWLGRRWPWSTLGDHFLVTLTRR